MVGGFGVGSPALWIPAYAGMTARAVILALRQYPQRGGVTQDNTTTYRHSRVGGNLQGGVRPAPSYWLQGSIHRAG